MKGSRVINCIANSFDDVVSILILRFFCKKSGLFYLAGFCKRIVNDLTSFVFMASLVVSIGTRSTYRAKNEKS